MLIRNRRIIKLSSIAILVVSRLAMSGSAFAQSNEELQRQIDLLKAQVERPEQKLHETDTAAREASPELLKVEAKGAPRFSGEGFKNFKLRGRLMTDIGQVGDPDDIGTLEEGGFVPDRGLGTTSELRRARIGVVGEISDWQYKLEADFAPGEADIADGYIEYRGFENVAIAVGQQKTPVSMDELGSTRFIKFMERGGFTDAFGFKRELGATVAVGGENWLWRSGAFLDGGLSGEDEDSGYILGSRVHYAFMGENGFTHLGSSVEFRDNGAQETRFRQRPFLHSTDTRLVDTGEFAANSSFFAGGEIAGNYGSFNISGEYGGMIVDLDETTDHPGREAYLQGGFLHLGYFLTGEQRGYDPADGLWERTNPLRPLDEGGWGALQINAGLDWVDLDDRGDGVLGGKQTAFAAGLTWVPISHVRVLANFSHLEIDDSPTRVERKSDGSFGRDISLNTFGLRTEIDW